MYRSRVCLTEGEPEVDRGSIEGGLWDRMGIVFSARDVDPRKRLSYGRETGGAREVELSADPAFVAILRNQTFDDGPLNSAWGVHCASWERDTYGGEGGKQCRDENAMAIIFSTGEVHPRDRLSYWLELLEKSFFRHTFRPTDGPAFNGEIKGGCVGSLKVAHSSLDSGRASRTARDQARDDIDDIYIDVRLTGTSIVSNGWREATHAPGTMVLLDARQPGQTWDQTPTTSNFACFPRSGLEARLGNLHGLTALALPAEQPIVGLAVGFLSMLVQRAGSFDEVVGSKLADQALDLLALAYSTELGLPHPNLSSARSTSLLRLKSVVEDRLCESDLKPAAVAAAAGISVRYANYLLSQEGLSVERYIQHRRLEHCRRALEDPTQGRRLIGDIAFGWGFSDLSHFVRRFRVAYAITPSDCRRRALERTASAGPQDIASMTEPAG